MVKVSLSLLTTPNCGTAKVDSLPFKLAELCNPRSTVQNWNQFNQAARAQHRLLIERNAKLRWRGEKPQPGSKGSGLPFCSWSSLPVRMLLQWACFVSR